MVTNIIVYCMCTSEYFIALLTFRRASVRYFHTRSGWETVGMGRFVILYVWSI